MRFTPLNFLCSGLIISIIWPFVSPEHKTYATNTWLLIGLLVIASIADIIFRTILKSNQKVWIIEGLFIILTFSLILLLGIYK